jgi:hypothetical protein
MRKRNIYFDEALHKYTDDLGQVYTSCTTMLGHFENKFDTEKMSKICAGKGMYKGMTPADVKTQWKKVNKESCDKGTAKHNFLEIAVKKANGFLSIYPSGNINGRLYTIDDILDNPGYGQLTPDDLVKMGLLNKYPSIYEAICYLAGLGFKVYPEVGVYNSDLMISGLIDLFLLRGNEFIILDWKTNIDELRFDSGYYKKDNNGKRTSNWITTNEMLKYPLNLFAQSHGWLYTFQLSVYAYLAEAFGLRCSSLTLAHIRENTDNLFIGLEKVEWYNIEYKKQEVTNAINFFNKQKRTQVQYKMML